MTTWDRSVDLVIAGSGGGGLAAAAASIDAGLEPLVLEKMAVVGSAARPVCRGRHDLDAGQPAHAGCRCCGLSR